MRESMYNFLAIFFVPFILFNRLIKSRKFYFRLKASTYHLLGVKLSESVRIEDDVDLLGLKNIRIGDNSFIGKRSRLVAYNSEINIGKNVLIATNNTLITRSHVYSDINIPINQQGYTNKPIIIEDDVWIGANCIILSGVTIGKGAVVSANSLVNKDVEPYTIVGGIPIKLLKKRS